MSLPCIVFSLRPIDIEFMKRLDEFVNIVPVIAKADTMTLDERDAFKSRVSKHMREREICLTNDCRFVKILAIIIFVYIHQLITQKMKKMLPLTTKLR